MLLLSEIQKYLGIGNFPQYIQSDNDNYLLSLYTDIIYKDVVAKQDKQWKAAWRDDVLFGK